MTRYKLILLICFLQCLFCVNLVTESFATQTRLNLPPIEAFILKWTPSGGSELGSSQSFLNEFSDLLDVPRPSSPRAHVPDNTYTFEKSVTLVHPKTGKKSFGRIDLYKQGHFIWESKQGSHKKAADEDGARRKGTAIRETKSWDKAMLDAKVQGERYARSLAPEEGKPPFLIVSDIGYSIEVYADFRGTGVYTPYPSAKANRFTLEDLRNPQVLAMFKRIWTKPFVLDNSRATAKVTKELAIQLADLATALEETVEHKTYGEDAVSLFIMRCIFTMFAEDVGLVEYNAFTDILTKNLNNPQGFIKDATDFWQVLRITGNAVPLEEQVLRFQGYLFDDVQALPLNKKQLALLHRAAHAHWADVDTAVFGYLLERALNPTERHALGAHYTPTAYVERLAVPTVMQPLREQWEQAKNTALEHIANKKHDEAIDAIHAFHKTLSETKVLDPSCGSGVFLAVTLSLFKELEAEVVQALRDLGLSERQIIEKGYVVTPRQFKGIEVVPRAVDISELVLWLTYLQQHYAIHGNVPPKETLFGKVRSVELRDAVLLQHDDGTSEQSAPWPQADYIVGNPPFVGGSKMREAFGDEYTTALRKAYPDIAASSDYVMFWWYRAAKLAQEGKVKRFGFITTSTINQLQNRGVMQNFLDDITPLSIVYAIPNHPWVDSAGSASVRIAMTVAEAGKKDGVLAKIMSEKPTEHGDMQIQLVEERGTINANLTVGVDVSKAKKIKANEGMAFSGVKINGSGFIVTPEQAKELGLGTVPGLENHIKPYINGKDIMGISRDVMVIDLYGLSAEEVQSKYPLVYQWLWNNVKPERDKKSNRKLQEQWWLFDSNAVAMRKALKMLKRYIVTSRTAKHRIFTFTDGNTLPDAGVVAIMSNDAYVLGVLLSNTHRIWAESVGSRMKNDYVYLQDCFETFPFPNATEAQKQVIREIAEKLDNHRKARQAAYPKLTLTDMYNVLEKVRDGQELTAKEQIISEQADITELRKLHDALDGVVSKIYGFNNDSSNDNILEEILNLNML